MTISTAKYLALSAGLTFALATSSAGAHHAFSAQYDSEQPVTLNGVVVKIDWLNPHAYFYVDVEDAATGEITSWACELTSPVGLMRRGWTRNSMKIGDQVVVDGILARDGSKLMNAQSVVLVSTGQKLFTRTPAEEQLSSTGGDQQ